jgi:hypothetical protein
MKNTTLFPRYLLLLLCTIPLFFSCKKDKDDEPEVLKPPAERILGTWSIVKETEKTSAYETGIFIDSSVTSIPTGKFTADFRTDSKIYFIKNDNGAISRDTMEYELIDNTLLISGSNYSIRQFTNKQLITRDFYDDGTANVEHVLEWKK